MAHSTRLDKLAGGSAFRLELAEAFANWSTGVGSYFDSTRLASISIHRGRQGPLDQAEPATVSFVLAGGVDTPSLTRELELADAIRIRIGPTAQTNLFGHSIAGATRFTGRVTDMGPARVTMRAQAPTVEIPVIASSIMARVDNTPGPYDLSGMNDIDALDAVLVDVWNTDAAFQFGAWTVDETQWLVYEARPASSILLASWTDAAPPSGAIATIAASYDAALIERPDGTIDWVRDDLRSTDEWHLPTALPTSTIIDGLEATKHIADLVTEADVAYGASGASTAFAFNDLDVVGQLVLPVETRLATLTDAQALADRLVSRFGAPAWRLSSVTLDLLALLEAGQTAYVETLLGLGQESPVEITGALPASSPAGVQRRYVIGTVDETIEAESWRLTFGLIDQWLVDAVQWRDWPAGVTWAEVPAGVTWADTRDYLPPA